MAPAPDQPKDTRMHLLLAQTTLAEVSYWPFGILAISVAFIIVAITLLRLHPFLALVLAALLAGWLSLGRPMPVAEGTEGMGHGVAVLVWRRAKSGSSSPWPPSSGWP